MTDLLTMRRAVARCHQAGPLIWETLGLSLAEVLAKMEGALLGGEEPEIPEAHRYVAENIDAAIASYRLLAEING